MIKLLARIFIKSEEEAARRKAYGTLCSIVGICLNVLLFAGKFLAGIISGSVAITADAFNNLSDAGSSFITLLGFWFAGKEPDLDHPFGHGRFEYISGFIVSIVILLMGYELLMDSIDKIRFPQAVDMGLLPIVILVVSVLVKLYMSYYNRAVGKQIDSAAMEATAKDSLSDSIATTVVLLSMLVMKVFEVNIDGYCGLVVSAFILMAGISAAKDTLNPLIGLAPEKEFVDRIEEIVTEPELVVGMHDLIVHDYGPGRRMISLHAEVPGSEDVFLLHDMIDQLEAKLRTELSCQAVIHMDPIETDNEQVNKMKAIVNERIQTLGEGLSIHDFRMVVGPTHTNLIFDVVVPFGFAMSKEEVREAVCELVHNFEEGNFYAVVEIDQAYV